MPKDPVCGMEVDQAKTQFKSVYKGEIYYFCSSACKKEFESKPEEYIKHGPKGMPSEHHEHEHGKKCCH
ncbi:MAG: YHS domain-containing protein [Thermoprotei archaeon]|nr:MAG: YHS domain-containing protein [Thermoprotei archaeon]